MVEAGRTRGLVWDAETLDRFLADPGGYVPGTVMGFPGIRDAAERADLVEYLRRSSR